jgi:serine/threonine-protein kinase
MIGRTISHYQILEKLGEGGMGVVYKAQDTRLDRPVALKFLPTELTSDPETRQRFVHEAKAASALDHLNICNVHDIGRTDEGRIFIVMAYYEGETLKKKIERGPLTIEEAVEIAVQVAQGLSKAHEQGIVHRDIKPANIIITPEGVAKIVDFGLAKLTGMGLVQTTSGKGTIAYMCPELIRGHKVDHRCDLWALGVLFYEMLAGRLPFKGEYAEPMMYSIVNEEPQPLSHHRSDVPEGVHAIIEQLQQKDPSERYQHAAELLADLRSVTEANGVTVAKRRSTLGKRLGRRMPLVYGGVALIVAVLLLTIGWPYALPNRGERKLIVVLPVKSIADNPGQEWLADGMTDALTGQLAQISGLRVISLSTAMKYKGTSKTPPAIAEELGVDYLVESSSSYSSDHIVVSARLVDVGNDEYVWAKNFEGEPKEVFVLFGDIAQAIAGEIGAELTPQERERFTSVRPVHPEAYELWVKGMYHLNEFTFDEVKEATKYFQKAIDVDSNFARAYVGLVYCYAIPTYFGLMPREEGVSKIRGALEKALELDENLAHAYQGLGGFRLNQEWDWEGAEEAFERALELNPNLSGFMGTEYAWYLMTMGRHEEAIVEAERLLTLDPLSYITRWSVISAYYYAHQHEKAIELCRRTIELDPEDARVYRELATNYEQLGQHGDAHQSRMAALRLSGTAAEAIAMYDSLYGELGPDAYPQWLFMRAGSQPCESIYDLTTAAWIHTRLGEKEKALDLLEKGYEVREGEMITINANPKWDLLRGEPRFRDLLRRMKFPE